MQIQIKDGECQVKNSQAGNIVLSSDYGNVIMENLKALDVSVKSEDGNVDVTGCDAGQVTVEANYGKVKLAECQFESQDITAQDGSVTVTKLTAPVANYTMQYGNLNIKDSSINQLKVNTEDGNVDVSLNGAEQDYAMDINAQEGDVTINGKKTASSYIVKTQTDKSISVDSEYGEVAVTFTE